MAVAAEAGGGIKINPGTGRFEAPDGSAARNYDPVAGPAPSAARQVAPERPAAKPAAAISYYNLFLDAGISHDQEVYRRCLDAILAKEEITADDIVGLGEEGIGSKSLYVVHRQAITLAEERGVFNKRIDVRRLCPIASIARVRTTEEGFRPRQLTITAYNAAGEEVLKIAWTEGFDEREKRRVLRQREHLFKVISQAMDKAGGSPVQPSVSAAPSKAGALRESAAGVVKDAGVELTAERIEEHANMAAGGIRFMVFLQLGAPLGISDLKQFYYPDPMPEMSPIAGFDDLYSRVIARVGGAELVDQGIDDVLADARPEFVRGCHERYS
jgi:hypothetical protein